MMLDTTIAGAGWRGAAVIGVTPCLQRTWFFDHLNPGRVNRAARVLQTASGKGTNVVRVLNHLGANALWLGFLGGESGRQLQAMIEREGMAVCAVPSDGATRTCETLVDRHGGVVTELVEEAATPFEADWEVLARELGSRLDAATAVVVTGTLPPGSAPDAYRKLLDPAAAAGIPLFVDTHGPGLWAVTGLKPDLVKINADELVLSLPDGTVGLQGGLAALQEAGAGRVLITRGGHPAILVDEGRAVEFSVPAVDVINPIGSGDAVLAGIVYGRGEGRPWHDAVRWGLACGTANALTETPGVIRREDVETLADAIVVQVRASA